MSGRERKETRRKERNERKRTESADSARRIVIWKLSDHQFVVGLDPLQWQTISAFDRLVLFMQIDASNLFKWTHAWRKVTVGTVLAGACTVESSILSSRFIHPAHLSNHTIAATAIRWDRTQFRLTIFFDESNCIKRQSLSTVLPQSDEEGISFQKQICS